MQRSRESSADLYRDTSDSATTLISANGIVSSVTRKASAAGGVCGGLPELSPSWCKLPLVGLQAAPNQTDSLIH